MSRRLATAIHLVIYEEKSSSVTRGSVSNDRRVVQNDAAVRLSLVFFVVAMSLHT